MNRRQFLRRGAEVVGGAAAIAAGVSPEQAEAAPTVEEFRDFLNDRVVADESTKDALLEAYREIPMEILRDMRYETLVCSSGDAKGYVTSFERTATGFSVSVECK